MSVTGSAATRENGFSSNRGSHAMTNCPGMAFKLALSVNVLVRSLSHSTERTEKGVGRWSAPEEAASPGKTLMVCIQSCGFRLFGSSPFQDDDGNHAVGLGLVVIVLGPNVCHHIP